jgi:F-type H+-transporting ATPase subunit delta
LIDDSADFRRLVRSPAFTAAQQTRALGSILDKAGIGGITRNFLMVVARNRRLFALPDMIRRMPGWWPSTRARWPPRSSRRTKLTAAQEKSLAAALKSSLGKSVKLTTKVDPALLGGLVVRVGSRMIDTSLRTKLNSLRLAMKEVG